MDDSGFESQQVQGLLLLQNPQTVFEARRFSSSVGPVVLARGQSGRVCKLYHSTQPNV